jgi:NADH-quinone oxidoreductase subunit E
MCTGRIDLAFILRAFINGADGVFIGGCWPGECHYITEGNYIALSTMHIGRKLLGLVGLNPERLRLEWVSASEGMRFAEVMNDFSKTVTELGTLGESDGEEADGLKSRLESVQNLVPYIKLVERERLRIPVKSEEDYNKFFASEEFERLFQELIVEKYEINQVMILLREKPLSTGEISEALGMTPSEASKHINFSAKQGLIRFDQKQMRYVPA